MRMRSSGTSTAARAALRRDFIVHVFLDGPVIATTNAMDSNSEGGLT